MKVGLVLSGGGAKGAFHLGVLTFLQEQNIEIEAYSGTSIGSIIAASHASGVSAQEQLKIFKSSDLKKVIKFNYFKKGLMRIDHENKIIKELLPIEKLEDLKKQVYINAYDLKQKQMHYFKEGNIISLCLASSALIPVFKPITYKNMSLIDGGLFDNIPIKPFLKRDYKILSLDALPRKKSLGKKSLNPLRFVKKKLFKNLHKNISFSIKQSDYYLTSLSLREFKLLSFKDLDSCYKIGYKEAQIQLKSFLKTYHN